MISKVIDFLVKMAIYGLITLLIVFALTFVFSFVMVTISIILGDEFVNRCSSFLANHSLGYRIAYTIIFVSLMCGDLDFPNLKTAFKQWWCQKSQKKTC